MIHCKKTRENILQLILSQHEITHQVKKDSENEKWTLQDTIFPFWKGQKSGLNCIRLKKLIHSQTAKWLIRTFVSFVLNGHNSSSFDRKQWIFLMIVTSITNLMDEIIRTRVHKSSYNYLSFSWSSVPGVGWTTNCKDDMIYWNAVFQSWIETSITFFVFISYLQLTWITRLETEKILHSPFCRM